jgi:hypothetical protein
MSNARTKMYLQAQTSSGTFQTKIANRMQKNLITLCTGVQAKRYNRYKAANVTQEISMAQ